MLTFCACYSGMDNIWSVTPMFLFLLEIHNFKIHQTLREVRAPQLSVLNPCPCTPPGAQKLDEGSGPSAISFPVPSATSSRIFSNLWPPFPCPHSQMSLQMLFPFCFENRFFHLSRKRQLASEVLHTKRHDTLSKESISIQIMILCALQN